MKKSFLSLLLLLAFVATALTQNSCTSNTFQVTGNGAVSLVPDIVRFSITTTGKGATAAIALNNLNTQINTLLSIFNSYNLPAANYSTSGININQVYDYSTNPNTITGSEATQTIQVTIGGSINLSNFLASLANLNVSVQNMAFDASDKSNALRQARAAAIADARSKFSQYLSLSSLNSDGLKKIVDLNSEVYTPYPIDANTYALYNKLRTPPPPPAVQASASVSVTWKVKF